MKFIVLYRAPIEVIDEWMKKDDSERKAAEEKMRTEWQAWMATNAGSVKETAGAGKAKRVTSTSTEDARNDVMMFSMVEAESLDAAAKMFEGHPHLGIPQATIDVMPANYLPGMA